MKRFANISIVSFALVALFSGAALAGSSDFFGDDESGYQDQAAGFKALLTNDAPASHSHSLQNEVDTEFARSFSEIQITAKACSADEREQFLALVQSTNLITDELGAE
jgi:hypothetical protein